MTSNSKLSRDEKDSLKFFKKTMGKDAAFVNYERVTVFVNRTGATMGEFTTSVASLDEKKIRAKVGQFSAMERYVNGTAQPIFLGAWDAGQMAESLAYMLNQGS